MTQIGVSVLLPVHDGERFLPEAVESILAQSFRDFELLAVDDGSRDGSAAILDAYARRDARVRVVRRPHAGLVAALNEGLALARGERIARMDADDIAHPDRLALQLEHLRLHPEILALGADVLVIDPDGWPIRRLDVPLHHEAIDAALLRGRGEALVHPAAMFQREALYAVGGYRESCRHAEDVDLYLRLAERGRLANLPQTLLRYRRHLRKTTYACEHEHRRILSEVLREARSRRGLAHAPGPEPPPSTVDTSAVDYWCEWVRQAVLGGNLATARKHALAVLRAEPARWRSWQLLLRALLGLRVEPIKNLLARLRPPASPRVAGA
jgi:glycosyltransferase involved in cell wall biosynthesis